VAQDHVNKTKENKAKDMPTNQMPSRGTIYHQICCKVLDNEDIYKFDLLVHEKLVAAGVREEGGGVFRLLRNRMSSSCQALEAQVAAEIEEEAPKFTPFELKL